MKDRKPRKKQYVEFEEGLISFDIAKLAKEKGCDINTVMVYDAEGDLTLDIGVNNEDIGMDNIAYPIFTQSALQKWLRDIHNIQIEIHCRQKEYNIFKYKYEGYVYSELIECEVDDDTSFNTYEDALEDALFFSLKLIKS